MKPPTGTATQPMMKRRRIVLQTASLAASLTAMQAIGATGTGGGPVGSTDWETADPESQGLRAAVVADALKAGEGVPGLRALLVARRGVLVAERYYGGAHAALLQPINSATKSVCSMLVGLALRDGRIKSLDETVAQLLPEAVAEVPDSPAAHCSLRQILSGRTGLAFDPMHFGQLAGARPLVRYALSRPAVAVPPPGWSYNDAMVALLAPILARPPGVDLSAQADRQLFEPLAVQRFDWRRDRDGNALAPAGLALRTRDLLKLAALMLEAGRWQGQPVLPAAWVAESLVPQGPATWRAGPITEVGYGYLWFTGRLLGQRVAWAWGYGGQFSLLVPGLQLAVATSATSPPPVMLREQTDAIMGLVAKMVEAAG